MKLPPALALLLAACGQPAGEADSNRSRPLAEPAAPSGPPAPAEPFAIAKKTDLYEFDFAWPAEASAEPDLAARLRKEMEDARAALVEGAEEEQARRAREGMDYQPFMSSTAYETAGQSRRLLSLRVDAGGYEGGAHGHFGVGALLWDRAARREIDFADLFSQRANRERLLTQRWCDALNAAREEKRGAPGGGGGLFDDCPPLDDIAIIPADPDRDGRFERLLLVASPYVAGPWVEGAYEITLAVTDDLIAGLKSEFQPSFEAQGRQ